MRALAYAAGLARRQHGRLIAVYVRAPLRTPVALSGWVNAGIVAAEAEAQKDMEDEVWTQIAADVTAWGCGARVVIRNGSPLAELRKVADGVRRGHDHRRRVQQCSGTGCSARWDAGCCAASPAR